MWCRPPRGMRLPCAACGFVRLAVRWGMTSTGGQRPRSGLRGQGMRRLDHSMIFLLIAGTTTPFCLLVLNGPLADALLVAVWAGAAAGIVVEMIWVDTPKWVATIVYITVGWIAVLGFPAIVVAAGVGAGALIAAGGILYTAGAVIYARQSPDPRPATFGYHEIFHVLVIAAAVAHFAAIALYALPAGVADTIPVRPRPVGRRDAGGWGG